MKLNWVAAALSIGAAGTDGAVALASEVPGTLAGVKVGFFFTISSPNLSLVAMSPLFARTLRTKSRSFPPLQPCFLFSIFPPQSPAPLAYTKTPETVSH